MKGFNIELITTKLSLFLTILFSLDRCSSNDSGLGPSSSSSSSPKQTANSNSDNAHSSDGSDTFANDSTPKAAQVQRRRFPKLGISSLTNRPDESANSDTLNCIDKDSSLASSEPATSSSDESSNHNNEQNTQALQLRTSTPQQSPSKDATTTTDNLLSGWPADQPLPTVEDLLYPGIKPQSGPSFRLAKNSRKLLSGFKTRTSTGLLKLKSTVTDMMKSERDEIQLQQQVFDKITKTARDEDDFSIHMIEEASLQRLAAAAQPNSSQAPTAKPQVAFPPCGALANPASPKVSRSRNHQRQIQEQRNQSRPSADAVRAPRQSRHGKKRSTEDQKRHRRNRRMITEVRRRVQEAHRQASITQPPMQIDPSRLPQAYRLPGKQLVYTRGGQVPKMRNGELDWNYLWFFSDSSSATTNSTGSFAANATTTSSGTASTGITDQSSLNQTSELNSTSASSGDSSGVDTFHRGHLQHVPHTTPTPPPSTAATGRVARQGQHPTAQVKSVMRQATKKRIRRLVANPPTDDNLTLLGMV